MWPWDFNHDGDDNDDNYGDDDDNDGEDDDNDDDNNVRDWGCRRSDCRLEGSHGFVCTHSYS